MELPIHTDTVLLPHALRPDGIIPDGRRKATGTPPALHPSLIYQPQPPPVSDELCSREPTKGGMSAPLGTQAGCSPHASPWEGCPVFAPSIRRITVIPTVELLLLRPTAGSERVLRVG